MKNGVAYGYGCIKQKHDEDKSSVILEKGLFDNDKLVHGTARTDEVTTFEDWQIKNSYASGYGLQYMENDSKKILMYKGYFKESKRQGYGIQYWVFEHPPQINNGSGLFHHQIYSRNQIQKTIQQDKKAGIWENDKLVKPDISLFDL